MLPVQTTARCARRASKDSSRISCNPLGTRRTAPRPSVLLRQSVSASPFTLSRCNEQARSLGRRSRSRMPQNRTRAAAASARGSSPARGCRTVGGAPRLDTASRLPSTRVSRIQRSTSCSCIDRVPKRRRVGTLSESTTVVNRPTRDGRPMRGAVRRRRVDRARGSSSPPKAWCVLQAQFRMSADTCPSMVRAASNASICIRIHECTSAHREDEHCRMSRRDTPMFACLPTLCERVSGCRESTSFVELSDRSAPQSSPPLQFQMVIYKCQSPSASTIRATHSR